MIHLGDITQLKGYEVPKVDIITGGSPCQDLSVAGKRAGLEGERSGLFMEQIRVIKEMREDDRANGRTDVDIRPRYMVWENVPGAFSSNKGEDFRCVLEETAKIADSNATIPRLKTDKNGRQKWSKSGAIMGDGWSIAWRVHDAQFWGVPQRRKRISLVADFAGGTAPEILFEPKSLYGNPTQSREEGQGVAEDAERSVGETSQPILLESNQNHATIQTDGISTSLPASMGMGGGYVPMITDGIRETSCYDIRISSDNTKNWRAHCYETNISRALDTGGENPNSNHGGVAIIENHPNDSRVKISKDGKVQTLSSRMGTGGGNVPMVMEDTYQKTTGSLTASGYSKLGTQEAMNDMYVVKQYANEAYDKWSESEKSASLKASGGVYGGGSESLSVGSVVRRLTPLECERLQGYPDGWTDIGEWYDSKGKKHKDADSPRYKALGNSIALPFWEWMAKRMVKHINHEATMGSLFDGIGGFPLVFSRAGATPVWASEIEEFPIAVTKLRFKEQIWNTLK